MSTSEPTLESHPSPDLAEARKHDPLWIAYESLATAVGNLADRFNKAEPKIEEASSMAREALSRIDNVTRSQVKSQEDFTQAIDRQTTVLAEFGRTMNGMKSSTRALVLLILIESILTLGTLLILVLRS